MTLFEKQVRYFNEWLDFTYPNGEIIDRSWANESNLSGFTPESFITGPISWVDTPEGSEFWCQADNEWQNGILGFDWHGLDFNEQPEVVDPEPEAEIFIPDHHIKLPMEPVDAPYIRVGSKADLNNILGFYAAITGKMTMETQQEKDLFMAILDISNEY